MSLRSLRYFWLAVLASGPAEAQTTLVSNFHQTDFATASPVASALGRGVLRTPPRYPDRGELVAE